MRRGLRVGNGINLGWIDLVPRRGGGSDTTSPTIVISSSESSPSFANPIPLTFVLSESSTDFNITDIIVSRTGTSLGNFAGSGANYTADLTITGAFVAATVNVNAGAFHDSAGNANLAATQFSITSSLAFKDEFTTPVAAPLSSPRIAEPGPGLLTLVDTNSIFNVTGGYLNYPRFMVSGDRVSTPSVPNSIGLTSAVKFVLNNTPVGGMRYMQFTSAGSNGDGFQASPIAYFINAAAMSTTLEPLINDGISQTLAIVRRTTGNLTILNNNLVFVSNTSNYSNIVTWCNILNSGTSHSFDYLRVGQLSTPFNDDYGLATMRVASPAIGEIITGTADALVEMSWTGVTGSVWNMYVRRGADDTHTWAVRMDGGTTIKLIEINSGEIERASAAQTVSNGTVYRVLAIMVGNKIYVYVNNVFKVNYDTATFNNNATGQKTDRAGANFIAWPRVISGAALTELQKINP